LAQHQTPGQSRKFKKMFTVRPLKATAAQKAAILKQASTGTTIPLWNYTLVASDGLTYSGQMVGRSPFANGHRSTTVTTYVIPVILTMPDGTVFDPTAADSCLSNLTVDNVTMNSPIFKNADYIMNGVDVGVTQYVDGFERGNFWADVSLTGNSYHTLLGGSLVSAIKVTVPSGMGLTNFGFCGSYGEIDINWWDNLAQNTLLPSLASSGVGPKNFPIFLFDSIVEYLNGDPNQCCVLGYHGSFTPNNVLQTYSIVGFDTSQTFYSDISVMSHEVGEWMDDPLGTNPTPSYGNIGQISGCQNNLEVGDALSGTYFPPVTLNNFTYNPQELTYFSWFYGQMPSLGSGGAYSNNDTFTAPAAPCP
jgi:hypothetical protein